MQFAEIFSGQHMNLELEMKKSICHHEEDHFTDDSVLTFALAEWVLEYGKVPLGDCDTVAAMAGGIAFAYYKKIPEEILTHCLDCLDERLLNIYYKFKGEYNAVINERGD